MATAKQPNRKRDNRITVRMSDSEYDTYQRKLVQSNMTANAYCVKCITDKKVIQKTPEELQALAAIQKQLSAIGNNINQIARYCNADGNSPPAQALEKLAEEVSKSWQLLKQAREGKA